MTNQTVAFLARAFAIQAQIEGMKVANAERTGKYEAVYHEDAFGTLTKQLEELAIEAMNAQ